MRELRYFFLALQFFTRIPVPAWACRDFNPAWLASAARYFPLVGASVGALSAAVLWLAAQGFPLPLAVLLSCAFSLLLTGAFHEDGLADTFDALGGHVDRERALAIMKDSRLGTYGTAALVMALVAKLALLLQLAHTSLALACTALVAAHTLSRALAISLVVPLQYAGDLEHSKARPLAMQLSRGSLIFVLLTGLAAPIVAAYSKGAVLQWAAAALLSLGALLYCWRWFKKRLGGFTGDTLGCCQQLCELAFYAGLLLEVQGVLRLN